MGFQRYVSGSSGATFSGATFMTSHFSRNKYVGKGNLLWEAFSLGLVSIISANTPKGASSAATAAQLALVAADVKQVSKLASIITA